MTTAETISVISTIVSVCALGVAFYTVTRGNKVRDTDEVRNLEHRISALEARGARITALEEKYIIIEAILDRIGRLETKISLFWSMVEDTMLHKFKD
jgi:hypothetical protein